MGRRKGAVASYALLLVEIASSLLLTPFLIRSLGAAQYGVYSVSLSLSAYFTLLDFGIGNTLIRYISKYIIERDVSSQRKFIGFALVFYALVGCAMMVLGMVLRGYMTAIFGQGLSASEIDLAKSLLLVTIANAACMLLFSVFDKIILAYEYFVLSKGLQIVKVAVRLLIQLSLLNAGFGAFAIVLSNLAITTAFGLGTMLYVFLRLKLFPLLHGFDSSFLKEISGYTFFVFLQMAATQINAMSDQILLSMFSSAAIVAVYAVGSQINQYFQQISGAISGITMPGLVKMTERGCTNSELQQEMIKIGRLTLLVVGLIYGGFVVFGKTFVQMWAGNSYYEAYYVALILMAPMVFVLVQACGSQILWAKNKHQVQALIKIVVAILNIGITILLIHWNPLFGAAIGTAISCLLGDLVAMNIVFKKTIGISLKRYYSSLMKGIIISILFACAFGFLLELIFPDGWMSLIIKIVLTICVYGFALFLFGANEYEKSILTSLFEKFKR